MSYDTYGLLACGAYALIARSQSWLTHIQGFHIVWWPGVLDHAQYSISRTYNLLQTTMSPKRWTQRVVPSWLNVTARCSFEGFAFDSSGTGASSSEVLVDLLAPATTLGGSDKVGFGCWEHIPNAGCWLKVKIRLEISKTTSEWLMTGWHPGDGYLISAMSWNYCSSESSGKKEVKAKRAKARPLGHLGLYLQNQRISELLPGLNFLPRHPWQTFQIPGHREFQISS